MTRSRRPLSWLAGVGALLLLAPAADAQEIVTPEEFRRLEPAQADGKRYQILYQKYLKLFGDQLKLHGGVGEDGRSLYHGLTGRLFVRDRELARRLLADRDGAGRPLSSKVSNLRLVGTARRTARNLLVLLVDEVSLLDSQRERFERLSKQLKPVDQEGAAGQREALARQIEETVAAYPDDREETAPLVAQLREEARKIVYDAFPPLPQGTAERIAAGAKYQDVALLGEVWYHPDVSDEARARAEELLDQLQARRYGGKWLPFEEFQRALGFGKGGEGQWVPKERLWLEAAAAAEKERLKGGVPQVPYPKELLEKAMARGEILRGMPKKFVVAACAKALGPQGAFPVRVETYEEVIDDAERSWELWVMLDGTQVYFLGEIVAEKKAAGGKQ